MSDKKEKLFCPEKDCSYECVFNCTLKRHLIQKHNIGIEWNYCDFIDDNGVKCQHKCKTESNLTRHKIDKHKINVDWKYCSEKDCKSKFTTNTDLKRHLSSIHNINVKWHHCDCLDENGKKCEYKTKLKYHLKPHKEFVHDIGNNKCEYCLQNRNTSISYEDKNINKKVKICRKCYCKATGKFSRIEHIWSDYIDKKFGTEFLVSNDKSLKSINGCTLYRPDKLYVSSDRVLLLECDEHQHLFRNNSYSCEEKRISDIYNENFIGQKLTLIRWNPDNYKIDKSKNEKRDNLDKRLNKMIEVIKESLYSNQEEYIKIYYLYYDKDNPLITKNFSYKMII